MKAPDDLADVLQGVYRIVRESFEMGPDDEAAVLMGPGVITFFSLDPSDPSQDHAFTVEPTVDDDIRVGGAIYREVRDPRYRLSFSQRTRPTDGVQMVATLAGGD